MGCFKISVCVYYQESKKITIQEKTPAMQSGIYKGLTPRITHQECLQLNKNTYYTVLE